MCTMLMPLDRKMGLYSYAQSKSIRNQHPLFCFSLFKYENLPSFAMQYTEFLHWNIYKQRHSLHSWWISFTISIQFFFRLVKEWGFEIVLYLLDNIKLFSNEKKWNILSTPWFCHRFHKMRTWINAHFFHSMFWATDHQVTNIFYMCVFNHFWSMDIERENKWDWLCWWGVILQCSKLWYMY